METEKQKINHHDKLLGFIAVGLLLYVLGNMYGGKFIDMFSELAKHLIHF
jgi:hypothetical protein